jgi:hypothetical protein
LRLACLFDALLDFADGDGSSNDCGNCGDADDDLLHGCDLLSVI